MTWTAQRKIGLGFLILAIVPLLLTVLSWNSARSLISAARSVERSNALVLELEHLQSRIKDVEVSQREFLLTGEKRSLTAYYGARRDLLDQIRRLENDGNRMWIEHLRTLVPQKFDEIEKSIDSRLSGGMEMASQLLMYDGLPPAMEDIRAVFRRMIEEEKRRLVLRDAEQEASLRVTLILFAALVLVNIVFVAGIALVMRNEDRGIRKLNAELEQRVAQRTEALQQSNEDLQQFAYVASHDLREPLRAVSSYTGLLERRLGPSLDNDCRQYMKFILDGAARMQALIQDLLDYSKAGEMAGENVPDVDTSSILTNVMSNLKVTIAESRAKVSWAQLPSVAADPIRLTQVFQNLIANGIKYRSDREPVVQIRAESGKGEVVFAVSDNGMGIDPRYQQTIFGIFKRLHGKEYEGSGIGLAMCKKIVDRMGGRIWVESEPGKGSTFYFTVPQRAHLIATAS